MRFPVVGLLGRLGQRRTLIRAVPPEDFGDEPWGPTVEALEGPIDLDLLIEAVPNGVMVRGTVRASARGACSRCLAPVVQSWEAEVLELHRATSGAAEDVENGADGDDLDYRLVEGDTQLDLDPMVRDALVVGRPVRILCRPDCAGLCPVCGTDRNREACDHGDERPVDPRWEKLRGLRLPPAGPSGHDADAGPALA